MTVAVLVHITNVKEQVVKLKKVNHYVGVEIVAVIAISVLMDLLVLLPTPARAPTLL